MEVKSSFMNFLKWFLGLFSVYADGFERRVDHFFRSVRSDSSRFKVQKGLEKLMQKNLIVVNVWLEKKFKGYKYLTKGKRRKLYKDTAAIVAEFERFRRDTVMTMEQVKLMLADAGHALPAGNEAKVAYLAEIMSFLRPGRYYHYIKTASFGKLLRDPLKERLEGDCNQIVTLYIYLYSLKFDVGDLRIKLLPEHVCLHFQGIDVEATNATFQRYADQKEVLPVTEIISTNLLDLSDFREEVQDIDPRVMVKSAQLAYGISSLKSLVAKNLTVAYRNLAISSMSAGDFSAARYFADESGDKELVKSVKHNEAVSYYKSGKYEKAISLFEELGEKDLIKACYGKEYNELAEKVKNVKTLAEARRFKATYRKMLELARKMADSRLVKSLSETLKKL